jgi:hypothetical protein
VGELIGYTRCLTVLQDLTAQREILASPGVPADRIYLDEGLTDTTRPGPGLEDVPFSPFPRWATCGAGA